MPSLDTTNVILGIIAAATAVQSLMLLVGAIWVARRIASLQETIAKTIAGFEARNHLPELATRVSDLMHDMHRIAEHMEGVAEEVKRATRIAQGAFSLAGAEVERATRGVRLALDVVEGGVRQATRVGAGVRAGIRELFARQPNGRERFEEDDAIARFEAGA